MLEEREKAKSGIESADDSRSEARETTATVGTTVESSGAGQPEQEFGGPKGPEPTRFGDWERAGRCIDF